MADIIRTDIKPTVTITVKEYESLVEDSQWLDALNCAGVDNWEGYHYAFIEDDEEEDN